MFNAYAIANNQKANLHKVVTLSTTKTETEYIIMTKVMKKLFDGRV